MNNIKIGISILSSDFFNLQKTIDKIEKSSIDFLHLDIMDGIFVPNISFGPHFVSCLRPHTKKVFDVHLMVQNPCNYITQFAVAGADIITVHAEADNAFRAIEKILKLGKRAGIAITPLTPVAKLKKYLPFVEKVMIMTVTPGFSGQDFIQSQLKKIKTVRSYIDKFLSANPKHKYIELQVDGGINYDTARLAMHAGATSLVSGSFLLGQRNITKSVNVFHNICLSD